MKIYPVFLLLFVFLFVSVSNVEVEAKGKNKIILAKKIVKPGAQIKIKFTTVKGLKDNAWIGIIPSNVRHGSEAENDKHDLSYQYLGGKTKGTLIFTAPMKPGAYDFRMHDTDDNGKELYSLTFVVK